MRILRFDDRSAPHDRYRGRSGILLYRCFARRNDDRRIERGFRARIVLAAAEIVRRWELADPRDRWKHTGEPPPTERVRNSDIGARSAPASRPHRTPQATIDAFWYVVSLKDPDRLSAWLRDHPRDTARLLKLL